MPSNSSLTRIPSKLRKLPQASDYLAHPSAALRTATSSSMHQQSSQFRQRTDRLLKLIPDPQSSSTVFRSCLQPSLAHLFYTDLITPTPTSTDPYPADPHAWHSTFMDHVMSTTTHFIRRLTLQAQPLPSTAMLLAFHPAAAGGAGYRNLTATAIPQTITALHRSLHYAKHGLHIPAIPPQPISPIYTASLCPRSPTIPATHSTPMMFQLYHHYNHLIPDLDQPPPAGLTQKLYQSYKQQLLTSQLPTLPITTQLALPSLLSPLTSLPLHSLPRFLPTNRIPPTNWRILLQRKLRLPLSSSLPSTCTCGKPLDPFGDHLFTCRKHSKTTLSNAIRNSFHTVLHTLGPLANFCRNSTDVQCEPTALLPHHPTKRPADLGFPPFSPTATTNPDITTRYVAIDITIPPVPPSASSLLPEQLPSPHPLHAAHEGSARRKFIGRTSQVDAALLMADLNANHITLLPFTIDHLGGLGHFTHSFLFGPHPPTQFPTIPKPPWTHPNHFPHTPAFFAYQRALHAPPSLLPSASRAWKNQTRNTHRFGSSRSTTSPSHWAIQTLSLNISLALTSHLNTALPAVAIIHPLPDPIAGPPFDLPFSSAPFP